MNPIVIWEGKNDKRDRSELWICLQLFTGT